MVPHSSLTPLRRAVAVVVLALLAMPGASAFAGGAPRFPLGDTCTMVSTRAIEKVFGSPIVEYPWYDPLGDFGCILVVAGGNAVAGGGEFQMIQLFPDLPLGFATARETLEDQRAIDALSDAVIVDLEDLGRQAYLNYTDGALVVIVTKKFVFKFVYTDSVPGDLLTERDAEQLISLARKVVKRAKK